MAALSDFYREVHPETPGCPVQVMDLAILRAAQLLCSRTWCWREWMEPVTVVAGMVDVDYELPSSAKLLRVESAEIDGTACEVLRPQGRQTGRGVVVSSLSHFNLVGAGEGAVVRIEGSFAPTDQATSLPDLLRDHYADEVAMGAKSRLLMQKAPWQDLQQAAVYAMAFERQMGAIKTRVWRGHSACTPRVRPHFF